MIVIEQLRREIKEREARIRAIQDKCSHPVEALTRDARANTGNRCSADDAYWYECHCGLCDKHWTEDQ